MFKKIVSRISFSPALVAQLGFYAKRLRKEQATRRLGLIFVALALVVQSLVVFQAPEPANASHPADMIQGGLGWSNPDLGRFLSAYDSNAGYTKDAMDYFGITRAEIAATHFNGYTVDNKIGWGWDVQFPHTTAVGVRDANGNHVRNLFGRPINHYYPTNKWMPAFVGHSERMGWFAINVECGNLVTDNYSPPPPPPPPPPANIVTTKSASNITQSGVDATKVTAKKNDVITYTVAAQNTGGTAKEVALIDNIGEVLKYARLTDQGGGTLDSAGATLSWPNINLGPGESTKKQYSIKMNASLISSTNKCSMSNIFADQKVTIDVGCSTLPAKIITGKSAVNVTQKNIDATKTMAKENDVITYSITAKNEGGTAKEVALIDNIKDVLQYARLTDAGGGKLDQAKETLSWSSVNLAPKKSITKKYTVTMNESLVQAKDTCSMTNTYADKKVTIPVGCSTPPANIVAEKTSINISQANSDATTKIAKANDRISFTLTATNTGGSTKDFVFEDNILDTLEYATLIDNGGAIFNKDTKILTWPPVKIAAGKQEVRIFTVQMLSKIPATPRGATQGSSHNCKIENAFLDASNIINVDCPNPKTFIENPVKELPQTGAGENIMFAGITLAVVTFFYFRSRQLSTEVRLVRRNVSEGVF